MFVVSSWSRGGAGRDPPLDPHGGLVSWKAFFAKLGVHDDIVEVEKSNGDVGAAP